MAPLHCLPATQTPKQQLCSHLSTHSKQTTWSPSLTKAVWEQWTDRRPPSSTAPCWLGRGAALLLLGLAEVVAEVEVAGGVGHGGGLVGDGHVLQVQQTQLDLHGEQDLQLAAHALAAHVPAQQHVQAVRPQAELRGTHNIGSNTGQHIGGTYSLGKGTTPNKDTRASLRLSWMRR